MKKIILFGLSILIFSNCMAAEKMNYVVPNKLKGIGYSAHTELTWENRVGFVYSIYRSDDGNSNFSKIDETSSNRYMDFFGKQILKDQTFFYRVMPKGLPVDNKNAAKFEVAVPVKPASESDLLDMVQHYTTRYFYDYADPQTGMARERSNDINGDIVTTGGTGFGIMALVAGAERNYFSRTEALKSIDKIVTFLEKTERFHGAWAHWYNGNTGKAFSFSQFDDGGDLVETAFMMEGLLTAREYFRNGNLNEQALAKRITQLWETVEWNWYTQGKDALYWHWSKNYGFKLNHRITGFDETLITYVLAASSPTFPIEPTVYEKCYTKSSYF